MKTITILFLLLPIFALNQVKPIQNNEVNNQLLLFDAQRYSDDTLTVDLLLDNLHGNYTFVDDTIFTNHNLYLTYPTNSERTDYTIGIGCGNLEQNSGISNIALGAWALSKNTYGKHNIAIGSSALFSNVKGAYNFAVGSQSLQNNILGDNNIAIGNQSLQNNKLGSENVAIGSYAGNNNLTGSYSVFIGYRSGQFETNSNRLYIANSETPTPLIYGEFDNRILSINGNVTIAGILSQTNTGKSVFIGENAGVNDDLTNNRNTFVGTNSGSLNTSGNYNNGFGYSALVNNTTGQSNVAIGSNAMEDNQTGTANTAIGNSALYQNTVGNYNVAIGNQAILANSIGNNNVAIGFRALYTNQFSNNTVIGYEAGLDNMYGTGNIFLGYQAGAKTSAYGPATSNKLYIENSNSLIPLIYGDFAADSLVINGDITITGKVTFINNKVPYNKYATGTQGQIVYGEDYIYICIQPDEWKRVAISTW